MVPLPCSMNVLSRKPCINSQATVWFFKCLQVPVSVSIETVFRNYLVPRNQSLRGNVFTYSFRRKDPYVTVFTLITVIESQLSALNFLLPAGSRQDIQTLFGFKIYRSYDKKCGTHSTGIYILVVC
jgi:hypothetical protein